MGNMICWAIVARGAAWDSRGYLIFYLELHILRVNLTAQSSGTTVCIASEISLEAYMYMYC